MKIKKKIIYFYKNKYTWHGFEAHGSIVTVLYLIVFNWDDFFIIEIKIIIIKIMIIFEKFKANGISSSKYYKFWK